MKHVTDLFVAFPEVSKVVITAVVKFPHSGGLVALSKGEEDVAGNLLRKLPRPIQNATTSPAIRPLMAP